MAVIENYNGTEFLNVSHSVGKGGANYWTDIMLVQFLIRKIFEYDAMRTEPQSGLDGLQLHFLPDPRTDYKKLTLTAEWIAIYQKYANQRCFQLKIDKCVNRMKNESSSLVNSTIGALNADITEGTGRWGLDLVTYALNDYMMPAALKSELSASRDKRGRTKRIFDY